MLAMEMVKEHLRLEQATEIPKNFNSNTATFDSSHNQENEQPSSKGSPVLFNKHFV